MSDQMIQSTLERLRKDVAATVLALQAADALTKAMLLNREADLAPGGHEAQAFITESLEHLVRRQAMTLSERARERAGQLGWQVATYEIAPEAKQSGSEPVVFITGNSYMPPLRAYSVSEDVWMLADELPLGDLWQVYCERLEERLEELRVYMAQPDYDNALYVVDLERFEYAEDAPRTCDECGEPIVDDPAGSVGVLVHDPALGDRAYDLNEQHTARHEDTLSDEWRPLERGA